MFGIITSSSNSSIDLKFQVVQFVCKKKTIQQIVLALSLLEGSLNGNSLAPQIVKLVLTKAHQDPLKLRFNTPDGCATNGVANEFMKSVFSECSDLICVSHTSNLPMKLFEKFTVTAHNFLQSWSQSLTQGSKVRAATRQALGEGGMRNHAIRWMVEFRTAVQVGDNFQLIKEIILNQDVGCASLMDTLRTIITRPAQNGQPCGETILRLELALIKDVGEPIAYFCNHFEGDGFLVPYAFDHWNNLTDHVRVVVERYHEAEYLSNCRSVAVNITPDRPNEQQELVELTIVKATAVLEKIESDSNTRFRETLKILRGCRLLGYQFIRDITYEALEEEIYFVQHIPAAVPLFDGLKAELRTYKRLADNFNDPDDDGWMFWRRFFVTVPIWYKVASEVALVMCSSAAVERVFSLLNCLFDDQQHQCLNDYKEASIMIRYNENFRERKQYS